MAVKARSDCPADLLAKLLTQYNQLQADVVALKNAYNDLVAKYNAHVHTENTAAAYTQNASTLAVAAGSQGATVNVTADTISLAL